MSRFIETIKLENGVFFNLDYHQARINRTISQLLPGTSAPDLSKILSQPPDSDKVTKCRVIYDETYVNVDYRQDILPSPETLQLVFDDTIAYEYKYEDRSQILDLAKKKGDCDDTLIVKNGLITDTSYGNLLLEREEKWYTPDSPLLLGTQRAFLLKNRAIVEDEVPVDKIYTFQHFMVINAMLPFDVERKQPVSNICK